MGRPSPLKAGPPLSRWPWAVKERRLREPVSSLPPRSLHQLLPPGPCSSSFGDFPSQWSAMRTTGHVSPLLPKLLWLWCSSTAVEYTLGQESSLKSLRRDFCFTGAHFFFPGNIGISASHMTVVFVTNRSGFFFGGESDIMKSQAMLWDLRP